MRSDQQVFPIVPGGKLLEIVDHVPLVGVGDGQHRQVAVHHAQGDAVAVDGGLDGAQVGGDAVVGDHDAV